MGKLIEKCVHTSPAIADTYCDNCLRLEVLTERKRMSETEKYYCRDGQHGYFDPRTVDGCELRCFDASELIEASGIMKRRFNDGKIRSAKA